jgi:hypothetical protein
VSDADGRLPNFLIAGVPKCGTTSLAAHLSRHPEVFMSAEKELHFFDRDWASGVRSYRQQFMAPAGAAAIGEATPTYVLRDDTLDRVVATLENPRLVVMVRHPVERAYSHFWFNKWRDRRSFGAAVEDELRGHGECFGYVRDGRYIEIVERVLARFTRERLHVVLLDDLRDRPDATLRDVQRFLGVSEHGLAPNVDTVQNAAFRFRSLLVLRAMLTLRLWRWAPRVAAVVDRRNRVDLVPEPIETSVRARLLEHYAEPNRRFADWLGRDLSAWSR